MLDKTLFAEGSLCVVGNINRDVKTAPLAAGEHLFRDGETSVDFINETIGGGGANSAFAAACLGGRVGLVSKVGQDGLGERLERTARAHRVTPFFAKDSSTPTGTSIGLAFESGHRHFISCLPASRALRFTDIDLRALDDCGHLLRADIWFSESMLYEGNQRLFAAARERGVATSIDLNWDPHWGRASVSEIARRKGATRSVLPLVDMAHGNACELMEFADAPDLDSALKSLHDWGAGSVVVHLGDKGAGFYRNGSLIVEPPIPAKKQINMTGTGDVLSVCMMLLHQRKEIDIRQRLRLANSVVTQFIEGEIELIPPLSA